MKAYDMQRDELEILASHLLVEKEKKIAAATRHFARWRADRFAAYSREVVQRWRGEVRRLGGNVGKIFAASGTIGIRTRDNLFRALLKVWSERCRAYGFARRLSSLLVDCCSLDEVAGQVLVAHGGRGSIARKHHEEDEGADEG